MRYPFDRVQKLRILPGSLFSYEELEFLEDDFAETKIVIDVEEALQDAFDEDDMDCTSLRTYCFLFSQKIFVSEFDFVPQLMKATFTGTKTTMGK